MARKAMKKTLERLRKEVFDDVDRYIKARIEWSKAPTNTDKVTNFVYQDTSVILSFVRYIRTLEDAYSEFAEPFDKKLEKMEKALEDISKPGQKEEGKKKPSYRV